MSNYVSLQAQAPPDRLRHDTLAPRNATQNARARHALTLTRLLSASMRLSALGLAPLATPSYHFGMSPAPHVQRMSQHKIKPSGKWFQNLRQTLLSLRGYCLKQFRPPAHPSIPSVTIVPYPASRSARKRSTKPSRTTLPGFHHFLCCYLSYSQRSHLSPMFHCRSWGLKDSSSPMSLKGS